MSELELLYEALTPLSTQPECNNCNLCEKNIGLVYLIGDEWQHITATGNKVLRTSDNVDFLTTSSSPDGTRWCTCFNSKKNRCSIYDIRPLCCRLYPIDLMNLDGQLWWILHADCPIAQRFERERKLDVLSAITVRIESCLTTENIRQWLRIDSKSQTIEAFRSDKYSILRLREFKSSLSFP